VLPGPLTARLMRVRALPSWQAPVGRAIGVCSTGCALGLVPAAHAAAPSFYPGPRGAALLGGLIPSRPVIPGPTPLPWEGRSTAHARNLERANATRDRSAEIPSVGAAPLVTTGRSSREVPSICEAIVGGGTAVGRPPQLEAALDGGSALNLGSAPWPG
jgi:hypothetical protein